MDAHTVDEVAASAVKQQLGDLLYTNIYQQAQMKDMQATMTQQSTELSEARREIARLNDELEKRPLEEEPDRPL